MIYNINGRKSGNVRHNWREKQGFEINRPKGMPCYVFWHFQTPVELLTKEGIQEIQPGACYLCSPEVRQFFKSEGVLVHDWMHLDEAAAQIWHDVGLETDKLYYPQESSFVSGLIHRVEEETITKAAHNEEMVRALLWQLFIRIARASRVDERDSQGTYDIQLRDLRRVVVHRIWEDWTVEKMAQRVNMSQSAFYTAYRKMFKCSPMQDLIRERIEMARLQLQYSDLPIAEIASRLGYHDTTHFSRQFRSMTGDCPSAYRKMNR